MGTIKNVIICVLLCFVLLGCGNRTQKKAAQTLPPKYALREMLDSCLKSQPMANNNDVTRSIFADTLKSKIQLYKGRALPYIEDVPMQYEMCLPYPNGQYVVKFGFGENTSKCKLSNDYKTTFQVFAIMDKEKIVIPIEVDGNINQDTIVPCALAGATLFTGGSSGLFNTEHTLQENISTFCPL